MDAKDIEMFNGLVEEAADFCYLCEGRPLPLIDIDKEEFVVRCCNEKCPVLVTDKGNFSAVFKWNKKQRGIEE